MKEATRFRYGPVAPADKDTTVVQLRGDIEVGPLYDEYSDALRLPGYFGRNLDALWDALSTAPKSRKVRVSHGGLPDAEPRWLATYLNVLSDVSARAGTAFEVVFPASAQNEVERLLAEGEGSGPGGGGGAEGDDSESGSWDESGDDSYDGDDSEEDYDDDEDEDR